MSTITPVGTESPAAAKRETDFSQVDLDQFLQLLITELQNQDPLNPMDNSQLVEQLGQIREIGATNLLTETLDGFLEGQSLTTASSLIGKQVTALSDTGNEIQGTVERVSVEPDEDNQQRKLRVYVGQQPVELSNIRQILGGGQAGVDVADADATETNTTDSDATQTQ